MTLQEAINTGKRFTRPSLVDSVGYFDADDIGLDVVLSGGDIVATDYTLEPSSISLSLADFRTAWDEVASGSATVKPSASSPLFAKLASKLFNS